MEESRGDVYNLYGPLIIVGHVNGSLTITPGPCKILPAAGHYSQYGPVVITENINGSFSSSYISSASTVAPVQADDYTTRPILMVNKINGNAYGLDSTETVGFIDLEGIGNETGIDCTVYGRVNIQSSLNYPLVVRSPWTNLPTAVQGAGCRMSSHSHAGAIRDSFHIYGPVFMLSSVNGPLKVESGPWLIPPAPIPSPGTVTPAGDQTGGREINIFGPVVISNKINGGVTITSEPLAAVQRPMQQQQQQLALTAAPNNPSSSSSSDGGSSASNRAPPRIRPVAVCRPLLLLKQLMMQQAHLQHWA